MHKKCLIIVLFIVLILFVVFIVRFYVNFKDEVNAIKTIENFFKGHSNHDVDLVRASLHYKDRKHVVDHQEIDSWRILEIKKIPTNMRSMCPSHISRLQNNFYDIKYYKVKHLLTVKNGYNIYNSQIVELAVPGGIWWDFVLVKEKKSDNWMIYGCGY